MLKIRARTTLAETKPITVSIKRKIQFQS